MVDVSYLSEDELATYVDEYVKRTFRTMHSYSEDAQNEYCSLSITASCHNTTSEYEITHSIGAGWGATITIKGNNTIRDGVKAMKRYLNDKEESKPTRVQPLLAAPTHIEEDIHDAEFTNIRADINYDVPL